MPLSATSTAISTVCRKVPSSAPPVPRRQIQVLHRRPDLQCLPVRGNVQTRLQRLDDGDCQALLLACAGLERLGLEHRITSVMQIPDWIPAAAQGVVTVQCRRDDQNMRDLLSQLHDADNADLIAAERLVIERLQGDCHTPLGVYAELGSNRNEVILHGVLGSDPEQGTPQVARAQISGGRNDMTNLAAHLAKQMAAELANKLHCQRRISAAPPPVSIWVGFPPDHTAT